MICSSQESDETRWFSSTRYFRLPSTGKCLNFSRLEAIQVSTDRKEKSSSTNHFSSSSSKLAISSHAATFVDQSFWWFWGVIKFLRSFWRLPFTTQGGRHRMGSSREMRLVQYPHSRLTLMTQKTWNLFAFSAFFRRLMCLLGSKQHASWASIEGNWKLIFSRHAERKAIFLFKNKLEKISQHICYGDELNDCVMCGKMFFQLIEEKKFVLRNDPVTEVWLLNFSRAFSR